MIPRPINMRTELLPEGGSQDRQIERSAGALRGGWVSGETEIDGFRWKLTVPGNPDALLDDDGVVAASQTDDRMPYWAYVWPAALPMAKAVLRADWLVPSRVLELGCGTGLVGLAALQRGHHVTFTDYEPLSVAVARHNAEQNGFSQFEARTLDWREPPEERYPVIIGCDLLYQENHFTPILDLLHRMLPPNGICWLGDGGRSVTRRFWYLARERGFDVSVLDANGELLAAPASDYQLFVLRHQKK
ncbi:MAG: methyltransferase domain-containing protein [Planctomycetaceae bacterium]